LLLRELSEAVGVSGHEGAVRQLILDAIKSQIDEHRVDALGNLIALKKGRGKKRRKVMVAAHMDEIGLMIVRIEKEGSLRFRPVGGIDDRVLLAKRFSLATRGCPA
jgi:putative aminopeptidase FrvX